MRSVTTLGVRSGTTVRMRSGIAVVVWLGTIQACGPDLHTSHAVRTTMGMRPGIALVISTCSRTTDPEVRDHTITRRAKTWAHLKVELDALEGDLLGAVLARQRTLGAELAEVLCLVLLRVDLATSSRANHVGEIAVERVALEMQLLYFFQNLFKPKNVIYHKNIIWFCPLEA